ncbi:hypothetical protein [Azohydromonas sediminis]|uniref:hypothetical protein n=1 Tax=Azohydromonas sediminis TaxID=2259674 RepID=UPI000E64B650|nr:hypothetical protein [Azohydromonas sediminis]
MKAPVETILLGHLAVEAVARSAMPDPVFRETGCTFAVPKDGQTPTLGGPNTLLRDAITARPEAQRASVQAPAA